METNDRMDYRMLLRHLMSNIEDIILEGCQTSTIVDLANNLEKFISRGRFERYLKGDGNGDKTKTPSHKREHEAWTKDTIAENCSNQQSQPSILKSNIDGGKVFSREMLYRLNTRY